MEKISEFSHFVPDDGNFYIADLNLQRGESTSCHKHDFYEFHVVLQGEFLETCNGSNMLLQKADVHMLRPEDCHQLFETKRYPTNILRTIAVRKEHFEDCLSKVGVQTPERVFGYFRLTDTAFAQFQNKTGLIFENSGNKQACEFLFDNILTDMFISGLLQNEQSSRVPGWMRRAYKEIAQNRNYVQGLQKFIDITGKTQEHVSRVFRSCYGITPTDYINSLRLKDAAWRLKTSEQKIIQIVYDCGFNNLSYFNRAFKAQYGLSPKEYREKNRDIF